MNIRIAVVVGMALLVSGTGWSQARLDEVAGSIKLNPDALVEKQGYVEDPVAVQRADRELLAAAIAGCSGAAEILAGLISEVEASFPDVDDTLPDRITAASIDLDDELLELRQLRLTDAFADPLTEALNAAEQCMVATGELRSRLASGAPVSSRSAASVDLCVEQLGQAESRLVEVGSDSSTAVLSGAVASEEEIIAAVCKGESERSFEAGEACRNRQYRALASITARTAENERIEPNVFAGIRRICAELQPDDFAARDICEVEKLTAVRLETPQG
ncbi:MAG: hypothetical protein V2I67_15630 [Thermoanaerobaculales bacterium]|jgi:hypothetical protein|nr:hypothetical protein [Thermoanaerobaculales bacterium]